MKVQEKNSAGPHHLSVAQLGMLLKDDESSGEFAEAATHLETCQVCQSRLTTIAADEAVWSDAQEYLAGASEPRWEPDTSQSGISISESQDRSPATDEQVLRLLGMPGHPEMLGRLGRYDIERVIGSGGMGIVLKAHDSELNRPIAIKVLAPHLSHVGAARERFAREGRAAAAVVHEHVVAIYNVESGGAVPFLVMQYVPGRSLEARVTEDGPLGVEEILRIGTQAASGLAAAHRQGLVHRDVKPANILLENSVERAVLTDFGLARTIDDASLTQTGILAGTPHYMSPEQAIGGAVDHRSDLFSLGSVLYFMATGHPPFRGGNALGVLHRICRDDHRPVWHVNNEIPDELSDLIDRLLAKNPGRRFASADEVQERLASLLSRVQRQGLGRRRFRSWRGVVGRRRLARWVVAALSGVALVAIAAWQLNSTDEGASSVGAQLGAERRELEQLDVDFFDNLGAASGDLERTSVGSRYLHGGDDVWSRELKSVEHELTELELRSGTNPE